MRENIIHPTAVIGPYVTIGEGNIVGPFAVIVGHTKIGNGNRIRAHACLGGPPEKHGYLETSGELIIGDNNHISEMVTIHGGTDSPTVIGNENTFLRASHAGHDSRIGNKNTISCSALIGGHSIIGDGATLGLGAILHQYSRIGSYAFLGMGSVVPKKKRIIPGNIYVGNPCRFLKNNTIGIQRLGVSQEELQDAIEKYYAITQDWAGE